MRTYAHEMGRMPAEPCGARRHGTAVEGESARVVGALRERMPGKVRREVRLGRDRPDARSAAAVRDRERLVQVQVRHVAAEVAEARVAEQRVEVRAVDVHLAARIVHGLGDLEHVVLVHAVRRRVRDHQARRAKPRAAAILARRSSRSTLPASSHATTTTFMPARTADAAFVPCADDGMRQTVRS